MTEEEQMLDRRLRTVAIALAVVVLTVAFGVGAWLVWRLP